MNSIKDQIDDHAQAIAELEARLQREDRLEQAYERSVTLTDTQSGYNNTQPPSRTRFYRDKIKGKLWGVCAGIADYTGIDVLWIRLGMIASVFVTSGFTLLLYPLIALLAPVRPVGLYSDAADAKFWQGVRSNSSRTAKDVRSKLRDIDRRIADIEAHYVSSNRRLSDEIDALR